MARAGGKGFELAALVGSLLVLGVVSGQLVTCTGPGPKASVAQAEGFGVRLGWASTDYAVHEPAGAAVVLDVVVRNGTNDVTQSTSIAWEPTFAAAFEVLESEPTAWRVHVTEDGWGVLDTSGVPANQDGSFKVWFRPAAGMSVRGAEVDVDDGGPLIRVIVDGEQTAGEGRATATHVGERAKAEAQRVFERGRAAAVADRVMLVPSSAVAAFPLAVGLTSVLLLICAAGVVLVLARTATEGPRIAGDAG